MYQFLRNSFIIHVVKNSLLHLLELSINAGPNISQIGTDRCPPRRNDHAQQQNGRKSKQTADSIRTWLDGTTWRSGGIGQGNSVTAPFYTPAFNGYGDFVADLYANRQNERLWA